jgi:hypothetical protein
MYSLCDALERLTAFDARTFQVIDHNNIDQERGFNALNACSLNKRLTENHVAYPNF